MDYTPDAAFFLAGIVVTILTSIGKRFGWVPDDRIAKQGTALVVSLILCALYPWLQGQALPVWPILAMNVFQTWITSMGAYAVANTARQLNAPVEAPNA